MTTMKPKQAWLRIWQTTACSRAAGGIGGVCVFAMMLAIYGRTLLPGVLGGDAGELQYAGPLLALVHPSGQPLYVMLGFVWSHLLPIGTVAYRMNLLAAVSAAAACGFLTWTLYRLYKNMGIAVGSGLTLGMGATFWGQAVIADKYAFTALTASVVAGLALLWTRSRYPSGDRWLYALSLAYGLSLLHHRSIILFAPALVVMVVWREREALWQKWRRTLVCLLLTFAPPLIVYPLFLPWVQARRLSPILWQPSSARDWMNWLLERHVLLGDVLVFDSTAGFVEHLVVYWRTLVQDYTPLVVTVAAYGFLALLKAHFTGGLFLLVSYILLGGMGANFRGHERQFVYYLPSFVTLCYAYGAGLAAGWRRIAGLVQRWPRWKPAVGVMGLGLVLLVPVVQFDHTYPLRREEALYGAPLDIWRQSLKTGTQGERFAAGMNELPPNAIVVCDWEQATVLWYYQQVEKRRPDIRIVYPIERWTDYAVGHAPLCLARSLPVGAEWHATNVGPLVCLQARPNFTVPVGTIPTGHKLFTSEGEPRLELVGYKVAGAMFPAGTYVPLTLIWRALTGHLDDYAISLRILNERGEQLWAQDLSAPVLGMYPTSRWVQGEVVADYHELALHPHVPVGRYSWAFLVYRRTEDGQFIHLQDTDGNVLIRGGEFAIESP